MSNAIKVVVVGATGKTGQSIVDGLLTSETNFVGTPFLPLHRSQLTFNP